MKSANELMIDIAHIQNATGTKRTSLIAAARAKFSKVQWSSQKLREWGRWAFNEGIK